MFLFNTGTTPGQHLHHPPNMTINVKDGGQWKPAKQVFVKDNGVWKEVKQIFNNQGGSWKNSYSSGTPPVVVTNGTISGSGVIGSALSYTVATFSGNPTPTVTYAWFANASQVAGQQTSYTPTASDYGKAITVKATATNAGGTVVATSNSVTVSAVAPTLTKNGTLSGNSREGSTLTYDPATFTGIPTPTVTYTWLANGATVQTSGTQYTTKSSDVGKTITVRADATNIGGQAANESNGITVTPAVQSVTFEIELWGAGGAMAWNGSQLQGEESRGGYAKYRVTAPENAQIRVITSRGPGTNEDNGFGYNQGGLLQRTGCGGNGASGAGGGSSGFDFAPSGGSYTWVAVVGGGGGCGKQQTDIRKGEDGYGYGGSQGSPSAGRQGSRTECDCDNGVVQISGGGGAGASGGSGGNGSCGNPQRGNGGGGNYQASPLQNVGGSISLLSSRQGNDKGYDGGCKITKQGGGTEEWQGYQTRNFTVSDLK